MLIKKLKQAFFVLTFVQMIFGQVTYKEMITSDGYLGMGAFTSTTKTYLTETARRTSTDLKFTGKFMKHLNPKGKEVSIVRLDKEVVWTLDTNKKKYTEQTFTEIKELMEDGFADMEQSMPEQENDYEEDYRWSKPEIEVKNLKETKVINGFDCNHYLVTVTTIGTHLETDKKDTMVFKSDLWNSEDITDNMNLIYNFNKKYLEAIGIAVPDNVGMAMLAGIVTDQMQSLNHEIQKLRGYAIINDMTLTTTKNAVPEEEPEDENISLRDIQRDFGGLLGKKIMKESAKKKDKEKSNTVELIHIKSELLEVSSEQIQKTKFEIEKDYKLTKNL